MTDTTMMPDEIDYLLAGAYEALQRHERSLLNLTVDTRTAVGILKQHPLFAEQFDGVRSQVLLEVTEGHALQMRLFDAIIARLRGT